MKKLGDAELEIMLILWSVKEPATSTYILERLKDKRNWALSTLMTILARLSKKGFVYCDRSTRTNYYSALVLEQDYKQQESRSFLEKLFGNSVQGLVAALYDGRAIDREDLTELRNMIADIGKADDRKKMDKLDGAGDRDSFGGMDDISDMGGIGGIDSIGRIDGIDGNDDISKSGRL